MYSFVGYQSCLLSKSFPARIAHVWFFSRVRSHVPSEFVLLVESPAASLASVWLDVMRGSQVMDVLDVVSESLSAITDATNEGMLFIVQFLVNLHPIVGSKPLVARRAFEWFLASMASNMNRHSGKIILDLVAIFIRTDEWLFFPKNVLI
jgi:hypothetical protein